MNTRQYLRILFVFTGMSLLQRAEAQLAEPLQLQACYEAARTNYPLLKENSLIAQTAEYTVENVSRGYLPQFSVYGQATYQSAVTTIPIKILGLDIPTLSKDQYRLYGELTQTIYDGGNIHQQKQMQTANAQVQSQGLEVELYKLKERVNQLFFGILLADAQEAQNALTKKDLEAGLAKLGAAVNYGAELKSNEDKLRAELLRTEQRSIELKASRKAYVAMLSVFVHQALSDSVRLEPPAGLTPATSIQRPELQWYNYQKQSLDIQSKLITARNTPKLSFFVQGGLGRPGLDMLNNNFVGYYIGGLRFNWNLSGFYTAHNERQLIGLNRSMLDAQQETFLFNTDLTLKQQNAELLKLRELIRTDDEMIRLRASVKAAANAQLQYGTITVNDFVKEVNAEDQARQTKALHEMQWLMTAYSQQVTSGN